MYADNREKVVTRTRMLMNRQLDLMFGKNITNYNGKAICAKRFGNIYALNERKQDRPEFGQLILFM